MRVLQRGRPGHRGQDVDAADRSKQALVQLGVALQPAGTLIVRLLIGHAARSDRAGASAAVDNSRRMNTSPAH